MAYLKPVIVCSGWQVQGALERWTFNVQRLKLKKPAKSVDELLVECMRLHGAELQQERQLEKIAVD
jgi:hypothetical protein